MKLEFRPHPSRQHVLLAGDQVIGMVNEEYAALIVRGVNVYMGEGGWQPADTAPKNRILLVGRPGQVEQSAYWGWEEVGGECWRYARAFPHNFPLSFVPTRWMVLPVPPKPEERDDSASVLAHVEPQP